MSKFKPPAGPMKPAEIRRIMRADRVTQAAVSAFLDVERSTVSWCLRLGGAGRTVPRKQAEAILFAAHHIAQGITEPPEGALDAIEWTREDGMGTERSRSPAPVRTVKAVSPSKQDTINDLKRHVAKLEKALDFYADYSAYTTESESASGRRRLSGHKIYRRPVLDDGGEIAREALGEGWDQ